MSDPAQDAQVVPAAAPAVVHSNKHVLKVLRRSIGGKRANDDTALPQIDRAQIRSLLAENTELTSLASSLPTAVQSIQDTSYVPSGGGRSGAPKETPQANFSIEKTQVDAVPGVQYIENEPQVELSPEVESFITSIENHQEQLPAEIVIADKTDILPEPKYVATPVIMLPITPEQEKEGERKDPTFSLRWLIEFSRKIMKTFAGKVIYRHVTS